MNILKGSWRTSLFGALLIIQACVQWAVAGLDGNPTTNVTPSDLATNVLAGWALLMARDNKVSSEQVGAAQPAKPSGPPAGVGLIVALLLVVGCSGCAKFAGYTERKEYDQAGKVKSDEVTRFRGFTFLDSKANLTRAKALQTDKTQSVGVDTSAQESSGKTVSDVVDKLGEGFIKKAVTP